MLMNHSVKKLLFFVGAAVLITGLIYVTSGSGDGGTDGLEGEIINVKEFKLRCDSLKLKKWNKEEFDKLQASLVAMKSNEVVNATDASNLNIYLNQSYASTLKDSCSSWLSTNGESADRKLFSELESIAQNQECSKMLSREIQIMRAYFSALQIPSKVKSFIQQKFAVGQYNSLVSLINSTARKTEIKHFSPMSRIASNGIEELNAFQRYVTNYDGAFAFYSNSKDDPDALDILRRLCPEENPKTNTYTYYLQQLKAIDKVCK